LLALIIIGLWVLGPAAGLPQIIANGAPAGTNASWHTKAELRRGLRRKIPGILSIGREGVAFAGRGTLALRWPFSEIQTIGILPHELLLTSYENRPHHEPGDRRYRFELHSDLSPRLASEIAQWLGKPNRNADPDPRAPSFASIPAKHHRPFGGSNGELRFSPSGIDFITAVAGDARAWRWPDMP